MKHANKAVLESSVKESLDQQDKKTLNGNIKQNDIGEKVSLAEVKEVEEKKDSPYSEEHLVKLEEIEENLKRRLIMDISDTENLLDVLQQKPFLEKYRCTYLGSDMVEERIKADMFYIKNYVEKYFQKKDIYALVLGGSYGLGEGGVKVHHFTEKAVNDYDIFVFVNERLFFNHTRTKFFFNKASKFLTRKLGIKVDFSCSFPKNFLSRFPIALRWYDLQEGHKVILGPPDAVTRFAHIEAKSLPIQEAFQLMLNRGVGLLQVKENLERKKGEDLDMIKTIYKAILAIGDSFLLINGHYRVQVLHRCNILKFYSKESDFIKKLYPFYEKAMKFRFLPLERKVKVKDLFESALELFQLFYFPLFSLYYGKEVKSLKGFYNQIKSKPVVDYRGTIKIKNILLNFIYVGSWNVFSSWTRNYPANRLFVLLPFFLFHSQKEKTTEIPFPLALVDELLGENLSNEEKDTARKLRLKKFFDIWNRFN